MGGYWKDTFQNRQQLQPTKAYQEWAKDNSLFGKIRGGVIIPNNSLSQIVSVWKTPDQPAAVLTTDTATFFGWCWGTDTAATAELDTAWLKAAINRYLTGPSFRYTKKVPGASQTCSQMVEGQKSGTQWYNLSQLPTPNSTPTASRESESPKPKLPTPQEDIDQLEQAVRLDVIPNSHEPISSSDTIALQQELENLIGRVESANLAASVSSVSPVLNEKQVLAASSQPGRSTLSMEQTIARSREIAKNIPILVANKNYALARQQWLVAILKTADFWTFAWAKKLCL